MEILIVFRAQRSLGAVAGVHPNGVANLVAACLPR